MKIALYLEGLRRLARSKDIRRDAELARRMDISPSHLSELLKGKTWPSIPFVAGAMAEFGPQCWGDLFAVVSNDHTQPLMEEA